MVKIAPFNFEKADLSKLSSNERVVLFLFGHAANELNTLSKLLVFSGRNESESVIVNSCESVQSVVLLRILIGKMFESWELFRTRFQKNKEISSKYRSLLTESGLAAERELNQFFSASNYITQIRNNFAFHYPSDDDIEKGFASVPQGDGFAFYLSTIRGNSFYFASELVVTEAMLKLIDADTSMEKVLKLYEVIKPISGYLLDLFEDCLYVMIAPLLSEKFQSEDVYESIASIDFSIPCFVEHD